MTVLNKTVTQILTNSQIAAGTPVISSLFDLSDATDVVIGYSIQNLEAGKTAKVEVFSDYTGNNASYVVESYPTAVLTKLVSGGAGSGTYTRGFIRIPKSLRYCRIKVTNNNASLSIINNFYLIKQTLSGLTKAGTSVLSGGSAAALSWSLESSLIDLSNAQSFAIGFMGRVSNTYGIIIEAYADPTGNNSAYASNANYHRVSEKALFMPSTGAYVTYGVIPMRIVADYVRLRFYNPDPYNSRGSLALYSIIQTKTGA